MVERLDGAFILSIADILIKNQVDTAAVSRSLELICNEISFECGMVYELDHLGQFCLMEHYVSGSSTVCKRFAANEWTSEEQAYLAQKAIYHIERSAQNTPLEKRLMDIFSTSSLILTPMVDENWCVYGLVAVTNTSPKASISEAEMQRLFAVLSVLVRYVEVRMYHSRLMQVQTSLENILDNAGIDIYVKDFNNHEILYVNKSMAAPYGGREKFMSQKCWHILFPGQTAPCDFCPQKKLIDEQGAPTKVHSWDYQRPFDGAWFRVFSAAFYWMGGRLAHVVSSANITDNKRNEALIEYMANYDHLTKLPNRRMLLQECERRIDKATATEQGYLLFFDIDGFKSINDNFGHDAGDELLILLGAFFSSIPLLKDVIYRNGGDEFVAIIGGEAISKDNIRTLGRFIHGRFKKPWKLKKGEVICNTSIGVSCFPGDGTTADKLIQKADEAMYKVKKSGGGRLALVLNWSQGKQCEHEGKRFIEKELRSFKTKDFAKNGAVDEV